MTAKILILIREMKLFQVKSSKQVNTATKDRGKILFEHMHTHSSLCTGCTTYRKLREGKRHMFSKRKKARILGVHICSSSF